MSRCLVIAIGCAMHVAAPGVAAGQAARVATASADDPVDVFATLSDQDVRLGLNASQTTPGAIGRRAGASVAR
jgi:hypothetical protein